MDIFTKIQILNKNKTLGVFVGTYNKLYYAVS